MKKLILVFLLPVCLLLLVQCNSKRLVHMNVMQPARITIPSDVNNLLLLDRTQADKSILSTIESVLTGEMPGEDKTALQSTMNALQNVLMSSPRFRVKKASERLIGNSLTSAFPNPIEWAILEELCMKYEADAIVAIEIYDTDFIVTNGQCRVMKKVDENGTPVEREVTEYFAEGLGKVKMGIRLYNVKEKNIVDQQLFNHTNTWRATGNSLQHALLSLIAKQEATKQVSAMAATNYAYKISPMPVRITREFYSKSKKCREIAAGARQGDVNDWQGAIKTWESGLAGAREKEAGKLAYNIAIAYEVLGELNSAAEWAGKAWVNYGNKKGREYSTILSRRKRDQQVLMQQME